MPGDSSLPKIVRNEWFYFVARFCMIAASTVGLPVAMFMMNRLVNSADEISATVKKQEIELRLLSQSVEFRLRADAERLLDHEARLRQVEMRR